MTRTPPSCFDKAAALLSIRPHFRAELGRKLRRRGYPESDVEEALDRLERLKYLDDLEVAKSFVRSRQRRGLGRRRLTAELERRGVSESVIGESLDLELTGDELDRARAAAEIWCLRRAASEPALGRHLDRKGFPKHVILQVLEERAAAAGASPASPHEPSGERHQVNIVTPPAGPQEPRDRAGADSDPSESTFRSRI
jgi:SOS response regulatory protein OraA/RecX